MLADLGAEVIKIESPAGDMSRAVPPAVDGIGVLYAQFNAGKRHVCIDIRADGGPDLVARLVERSDVVIENFRPGALRERGLGYDALSARNPRLIYLSISGFGQDGPWVDRRAHAPLLHAEGGTIEAASRLRGAPPVPEIHQHADLYSGYIAVSAVCAALYQRDRTGQGQHLDVALAEALVYASDQVVFDLLGYQGPREFDTWTYAIVTAANGEMVCLVGNPLRLFDRWMAALGRAGEPPAADEPSARERIIAAGSSFPDAASLIAALNAHGLVGATVQPVTALLDTEWARERGILAEAMPGVRVPARPFRSTGAEIGLSGPAAPVGADTRTVLAEVLGLDQNDLDGLAEAGIIRG